MANPTSPKAYVLKQLTPTGVRLMDTADEFKGLPVETQNLLIADAAKEMEVLGVPIKAVAS